MSVVATGTYALSDTAVTFSSTAVTKPKYSGSTLAMIRSKVDGAGTAIFDQQTDLIIGSVGVNCLSDFVLSATTGPLTAYTNSGITVSLDETKENYIVKVFGKNPENNSY
jgi:hypothetical protein